MFNTKEEQQAFYDKHFNSLDKEIRDKAIKVIKQVITPEELNRFKTLYEQYGPNDWFAHVYDDEAHRTAGSGTYIPSPYLSYGMIIKSALRGRGLADNKLPSADQNWDNYYIQIIEAAAGLREVPNE